MFKNESNWRMASNRDILNNLCLHGDKDATIVSIECPQEHSMNAIIVTRESVARLCGFGVTLSSRYLDDQVQLCATITYCNNCSILNINITSNTSICMRTTYGNKILHYNNYGIYVYIIIGNA